MKTSQSKSKLVQDLKAITGDKYILTAEWSKQPYCKDGDMVLEKHLRLLSREHYWKFGRFLKYVWMKILLLLCKPLTQD